ncbi:MAG: flagellar basal body P-ring formation protein FlgA [Opitutae bacterium]|nr:flagellar basal body P-ring formation protein FlgA [Opitutae bacterium]
MRPLFIFLFLMAYQLTADVSRFIESIDFPKVSSQTKTFTKSAAFISPTVSNSHSYESAIVSKSSIILLDRETLEKRLGESIAHRFQTTGVIKAYLSREWNSVKVSPNYLIKISDCSPDTLSSSIFARFSIWDSGKLVGDFAEPLRIGHFIDVLFSKTPLTRGVRLDSTQFESKLVDILKQHAGTVPANSNLNGYQLASTIKSNTPIKWNFLSKITLVKKGQIVDVFASGNGIYVTMKGMALENGVAGGNVTIRNLSSDKKFQAKVLNENSVKVHL